MANPSSKSGSSSSSSASVRELISMFERLCGQVSVVTPPAVVAAVVAHEARVKLDRIGSVSTENSGEIKEQPKITLENAEVKLKTPSSSAAPGHLVTERRIAKALPHFRQSRYMPDTSLTREGFCQKLNELLKLHLFIQRFVQQEMEAAQSPMDATAPRV